MTKQMDRRAFLKTASTAALAGPLILSGCATSRLSKKIAANEKVTLGAIGLGWQGPGNLGQFLQLKDVQVIAVCDVDKKHLARSRDMVNRHYENRDCATYTQFEELLGRGDLDAVSIALPDHWHAIPAIMAADKGLDVYGEKPLSHKLTEGRAMCNAIQRNKRIWQTGSWQRSKDNFHRACELVRNGRIGKVRYAEVGLGSGHSDYADNKDQTDFCAPPKELDYDRWLGPAPDLPYAPARVHKNWRWVMAHGGGRLMDWVGHHLDICHWGLGFDHTGPVTVKGKGQFPPKGNLWDAPVQYDCMCTYADGTQIRIESDNEVRNGTCWFGDEAWLHVNRGGHIECSNPEVLKEITGNTDTKLYKSTNHFANFIECVKSRKETITPCETAHRSASVGHLCNIALYTGRTIHWDPETEIIRNDPGASAMLAPDYRAPWTLKG